MSGITLFMITTLTLSSLIVSSSAQLPCISGSIRLRGSLGRTNQGRLEVCNAGSWGTVCDDFFGVEEARVACSQLGFTDQGAEVIRSGYLRGSSSQRILLDDVRCNGTEESIFNCNARPIGSHNCWHSEDVGVRCRENTRGDIRLRGRQSATSGRVEVFNGTAWGTVCDDYWSSNDAVVACRQLGISGSAVALRLGNGYTRLPTTSPVPIVLDNLRCSRFHRRLIDCPHNGVGVHNCYHNEDAGVRCGQNVNAVLMESDLEDKEKAMAEEEGEKEKLDVKNQQDDDADIVTTSSPDPADQGSLNFEELLNALKDILLQEK